MQRCPVTVRQLKKQLHSAENQLLASVAETGEFLLHFTKCLFYFRLYYRCVHIQGGPNTHLFHSDGFNNNKYVIKQWFYQYFKIVVNNSM